MRDGGYDDSHGPIRLAAEADFHLGRLEIRPSSREFGLAGQFRMLEPRVVQVLVVLAKAGGRIVSRDELTDRCWDGRIVSESALNRVISQIRKLSTYDREPVFRLETIPKVGYRLSVVSGMSSGSSAHDAGSSLIPAAVDSERIAGLKLSAPDRRTLIAGLAGGAIASGLGLAWFMRPDPRARQVAELLEQSEIAMRMGMPDSDLQGVGFLKQAVALRPNDARAWGRLALAQTIGAQYAPSQQAGAIAVAVQQAARRALALDSRQIDALAALAVLPPVYGDWYNAERRLASVLAIDPHHLLTLDARNFFDVAVGRSREGAKSRLSYAASVPLDAHQQLGLLYGHWILGDVAKADQVADRALQLWPKHPGLWVARFWIQGFTGRADRTAGYFSESQPRPDLPPWFMDVLRLSMKALVTRKRADIVRARDTVLKTVEHGPSQSVSAIMVLCGLGELDSAFDVARAYLLDEGPLHASLNWTPGQPSVNDQHHRKTNMLFIPVAAEMRRDGRFAPLMAAIGLTDYWRRAGVKPDHLA